MRLDILGSRLLLRAYSLPERSSGGIIFPESYRKGFDGKLFEVEGVGSGVGDALTIVGTVGDKLVPALRSLVEGEAYVPEKDDIIQLRGGGMKGVWAGPEVRNALGYDCWFVNVEETVGDGLTGRTRLRCAIEWVWPCASWKEEAA